MASDDITATESSDEQSTRTEMTGKEKADALTNFLRAIFSWPIAALLVIFLIREQIPDIAKNIYKVSIGDVEIELRQEIKELKTDIARIEQSLACGGARTNSLDSPSEHRTLLPEVEDEVRETGREFAEYLRTVGFPLPNDWIDSIRIEAIADGPGQAWTFTRERLICLSQQAAANPDTVRRQFAYVVMVPPNAGSEIWSDDGNGIRNGLVNYFPASFSDKFEIDNSLSFDTATPIPNAHPSLLPSLIWGGTFWDLREELGKERADSVLQLAWTTLDTQDLQTLTAADFAHLVVVAVDAAGDVDQTERVREIFAKRGIAVGP